MRSARPFPAVVPDLPGRSTIAVSDISIVNFARNRRQELSGVVEAALRRKLFPGAELLVARNDELLLHEAWGHLEVGPDAAPMQPGTVFDIASITKPVATATCLLILLEQGLVGLEDKVTDVFPEFDTPEKRGITWRHLMTHTSGLPHWMDFYSAGGGRAEALQKVLH